MKTFFFALLTILVLSGCVPESQYNELKEKYDELVEENESLKEEINSLQLKKAFVNNICTEATVRTELKSYLEFYCPDCLFKDFKIRKVDDCKFDISMLKKSKDNQPYASWISVIVRMSFTEDGKYTVEDVEGSHRWACDGL